MDIIIERMHAGLELLPDDPKLLIPEVKFWYRHLAQGGLWLAQVPQAFETYFEKWSDKASGKLEIQTGYVPHYSLYEMRNGRKIGVIRIRKLKESPEEFPFT